MTNVSDREIINTRLLNAPRALVFKVWTNPDDIGKWWGPNGFTTTTHEMRVEPGGCWRYIMHGPDGTDYDNRVDYLEVVAPERIVYLHGERENDPNQFHVTVTFDEHENKTKLTMRMVLKSPEELERVKAFGAVEGGIQTINRLEALLAELTSGISQ